MIIETLIGILIGIGILIVIFIACVAYYLGRVYVESRIKRRMEKKNDKENRR